MQFKCTFKPGAHRNNRNCSEMYWSKKKTPVTSAKQQQQRQFPTRQRRGQTCQSRDCVGALEKPAGAWGNRVLSAAPQTFLFEVMLSHRLSQGQWRWKVGGWRKWRESNKGEKTTVGYKWYRLGREINKPCLVNVCFVMWKKMHLGDRLFGAALKSLMSRHECTFLFFSLLLMSCLERPSLGEWWRKHMVAMCRRM